MPPIHEHQMLAGFLFSLLNAFLQIFPLGEAILAPFEVKLWPNGPSREPDILFVARENDERLTEKRVEGPPDLIIEIISPGTARIDRVEKFTEYERASVPEYWLVDPRQHRQQADFYLLEEGGSYTDAVVDESGIYRSAVLPGFWLRLDWLWQDPLPNPQVALAEIVMTAANVSPAIQAAYRALYQAFTETADSDPTS